MNRSFHKSQPLRYADCNAVEVKSKGKCQWRRRPSIAYHHHHLHHHHHPPPPPPPEIRRERCQQQVNNRVTSPLRSRQYGAEFRRFSVDRVKPGKFQEFYKLVMHVHHIANMEVMIGYADVHGDLLPINNDDNFCKAVTGPLASDDPEGPRVPKRHGVGIVFRSASPY
ncbi:hypothetical protein CRUP_011981 [Coryphaenoides rupestris]|nr:hypothetical protein CRUP_011981 [Coryphaenoides rupestris]